jgi:hypothetical protein
MLSYRVILSNDVVVSAGMCSKGIFLIRVSFFIVYCLISRSLSLNIYVVRTCVWCNGDELFEFVCTNVVLSKIVIL